MANFDNIIQEINTNLPDNNNQAITAAKLRTTLIDLTNTIDTVQDDFETEINNTIVSSIVDNLNSTDTDKSLSSNQGRVLKEEGSTVKLVGANGTTVIDSVRCFANHRYRIFVENTTPDWSGVSSTSSGTVLFTISNRDLTNTSVGSETMYFRGCDDKTTPLQSYYDVKTVQDGYLAIGIKATEGEEISFKIVEWVDNKCDDGEDAYGASALQVMKLKQKVSDVSMKETKFTPTYSKGYVIGATGLINTNSISKYSYFNVQGYNYVRFLGAVRNISLTTGYSFTDANDDLINTTTDNVLYSRTFDVDTTQTNMWGTKDYFIKVPDGAKWFKTTVNIVGGINLTDDFYCYGLKGATISDMIDNALHSSISISRETNCVSEVGNKLTLKQGSIDYTTGKWNAANAGNHYLIPLQDDNFLSIKGNNTNNTYITFLRDDYLVPGEYAHFATGFYNNIKFELGEEITFAIPPDAKFLYIQQNPSNSRMPQNLVISKYSRDNFEGIEMLPTNITNNYYLNDSYTPVSNTSYSIVEYDVSNVSVIGVYGKIALVGTNVFYNSNDEPITHFLGYYSTNPKEINFNDVVNVPSSATKLKLSLAKNIGYSVRNCVGIKNTEPRNLLTGKKVSFLGDSITAGTGSSTGSNTMGYRWTSIFSRSLARCVENNLGNPGTCLCTATKNGRESERFITRVSSETIGDSDVIFIWGGTNDFSYDSKPIGDLFVEETITSNTYIGTKKRVAPTDTDAFPGALHELLSTVRTLNPTAKVVYLTIMNRGRYNTGAYSNKRPTSFEQNANGDWITDYNDAIHKICDFYAVPVIDINSLLNQNWAYDDISVTPEILQSMDNDGIHPNDLGHKRIAEIVFNYVINNRLI